MASREEQQPGQQLRGGRGHGPSGSWRWQGLAAVQVSAGPWRWMRLEKPELNLEGQVDIYEELDQPQEKIPGRRVTVHRYRA